MYSADSKCKSAAGSGIRSGDAGCAERRKCDAVVTDMPTGMAALVAYPDFKLLDFAGTDGDFEVSEEEINIGISVKKDSPLTAQLNEALKDLTTEDFDSMMEEAISVQPLSE